MTTKSKPRSRLVATVPVAWHETNGGFDLRIVRNGEVWAHVYQDGSWTVYEDGGNGNYGGKAATPALARRAVEKALGVRRVKA